MVDDQKNTAKVLTAILTDEGYRVLCAGTGQEALALLGANTDIALVLSDLKMPGMDGIELNRRMQEMEDPPPFVIMTAYGTVKSAVQAMKEGVANYLMKPLDFEELAVVVERVIRESEMSRRLSSLESGLAGDRDFHGIIGCSGRMQEIFDMVRTVGATDASVMIYGETGTGKELLARALHNESERREANLVCINSAALTETLLEAELFGYVKGAFTGAGTRKKGRLEIADGGTLFLDEIGHMSLRLQSKLLRFLQERKLEPVGGVESKQVDVRIIAATNLDLKKLISEGGFLRDLLYRIEVIAIRLPPLRERKEDIPLLTERFVRLYAEQYGKRVEGVAPEAMDFLITQPWHGNVRELKNSIARAVIMCKGNSLKLSDLADGEPTGEGAAGPDAPSLLGELPPEGVTIKDMEAELIKRTLDKCDGNKSLAARRLGISRKSLYEKLGRYSIPGD